MKNILRTFTLEESGQGMVEYALILALVSAVVIGTLTTMGSKLNTKFDDIQKIL